MKRFRVLWLVIGCSMASLAVGDTIHLKNGKSIEGDVLTREADRVWLNTDAGRVPLPLARVAESSPETLDEAWSAFGKGEHEKALRLAEIYLFWNPGDEDAESLILRSRNQIELAALGREISEREGEARTLLEELESRLRDIDRAHPDPGVREAQFLAVQTDAAMAAQDFEGTSISDDFLNLAKKAGALAVEAHEEVEVRTAEKEKTRELERIRMRGEALGIEDFDAPVATLNKGGQMVDIEHLLFPEGITVFDFYADWCAPCRELDPHLRKIAREQENVYLRRINILDWDTPIARQYNLKSIPSVWVFDAEGELVESKMSGLTEIREAIRKAGGR